MSRRPDRLTPSLWLGGVEHATAELPRGQGAFAFPPAEAAFLRCDICDAQRSDVARRPAVGLYPATEPLCDLCWTRRNAARNYR